MVTRRQPPDRVHIRFTRQGVQATSIAVFCLFGAVVRDLNLLVVLAGLIGSSLWLQWRLGRGNLIGVFGTQKLPGEVFAGKSFPIFIRTENQKHHRSALQLTLSQPIRNVNKSQRIHALGSCFIPTVLPTQSAESRLECLAAKRGRYQLGPLDVESTFPLGLLRARKTLSGTEDSLLVLPQLLELRRDWRLAMRKHAVYGSRPGNRAAHHEGQFFGLRTWQTGDNRRWIHWRTTARIGELAVRQFEHPRGEEMLIFVDLCDSGPLGREAVERAISLAATIIELATRNSGFHLGVGIAGVNQSVTVGTANATLRSESLQSLALAEGTKTPSMEQLIIDLGTAAAKNWPLLVISTRPFSQTVWNPQAQNWLEHRRSTWIDVTDPSTNSWITWSLSDGSP